MTKRQRLEEVFRRLLAAPPPQSAETAFALFQHTVNAVEDKFSGVPYDPRHPGWDGRMYLPPVECDPEYPGYLVLRSRGEETRIGPDGAIEVHPRAGGSRMFRMPAPLQVTVHDPPPEIAPGFKLTVSRPTGPCIVNGVELPIGGQVTFVCVAERGEVGGRLVWERVATP